MTLFDEVLGPFLRHDPWCGRLGNPQLSCVCSVEHSKPAFDSTYGAQRMAVIRPFLRHEPSCHNAVGSLHLSCTCGLRLALAYFGIDHLLSAGADFR